MKAPTSVRASQGSHRSTGVARRRAVATGARARSVARAALGLIACTSLAATALADDPFLRRTATVGVVERVGPSVVNVTTERLTQTPSPFNPRPGVDPTVDDFFRSFFEPRPRTTQSLGSGVIFDREGHVLTNEHVIARADRVRVTMADGREFDAELVGADMGNDLAVLRILSDVELPFTPPGRSDDLMVGEPVIAIGNPFGFSNSVTTGVISATNRSVNAQNSLTFHGLIQTDALINPGNSGGPLLNADGQLIGINASIYDGAQGIGFAIPIDVARRVIRELLLYGEVHPVWLGLEFTDLDPALREVIDLPDGVVGVLVNRIEPGSPAARAGVRRGDVIARVDGRRIKTALQLIEMLEPMTAGQAIEMELVRAGELLHAQPRAEELPQSRVAAILKSRLGLTLRQRSADDAYEIVEVDPDSAARALGLRRGDALLAINGVTLGSHEDLRKAVARLRGLGRALVVVQRGPGRYHLTLPLL
ncbi:MAG: trypsin-like peptidase domain-containing protein [Spirochaetaceae bacterium]|nr:trypsin-like peptidase domain-containing protein [Myxococcales bacterium]MCB9726619.1 trypsin-like peptidase domain-containing protein [Spirochaetaceae bacterium]HPG26680.1 trypsin-like peptidase domain-containing protein [Myxococcota bacterium]